MANRDSDSLSTDPPDGDRVLIVRLQADPGDSAAAHELWQKHSDTVRKTLVSVIYRGGLCPTGWRRETFLESCFSAAYTNLTRRIGKFEFGGSFDGWLGRLAASTAIDEFRQITKSRPGPKKRSEGTKMEGGQNLSRPERIVQLDPKTLEGLGTASAEPNILPGLEEEERNAIIRDLLRAHAESSDDNCRCAVAIRLRHWSDFKLAEIAARFWGEAGSPRERNRGEKAVERILVDDYRKLEQSLACKYRIHFLGEI
jgi:DNA-directed RNA polymerase specialized sigma24 family protein